MTASPAVRQASAASSNPEAPIAVMERYELKFVLTAAQTRLVRRGLVGHMVPDQYGKTSIASLYYDTPDRRLIRQSLEKPEFKEKLRLRTYGRATEESPVFLELKRKAGGIVYKRRIQATLPRVRDFWAGKTMLTGDGQIGRELVSFKNQFARLEPSCVIIYDRTAYVEPEGDLRLTIDENPRYRTDRLELTGEMDGISLLEEGGSVLEVKIQQAMPLWLAGLLSAGGIYKTSYSKYGAAYCRTLRCG